MKDIPEAELKRFPVEQVSWDDAQLFLRELNKRDKQEGWVYRLPKEVEWEYACRGGPMADKLDSAFDFYFEKPVVQLQAEQANFKHDKGLNRTCKVGSYKPNRLGLYDMHGNVWEWCEDEQKLDKGASSPGGPGRQLVDDGRCRAASRRRPRAGLPGRRPGPSPGPSSRRLSGQVRQGRVPRRPTAGAGASGASEGGSRRAGAGCGREQLGWGLCWGPGAKPWRKFAEIWAK